MNRMESARCDTLIFCLLAETSLKSRNSSVHKLRRQLDSSARPAGAKLGQAALYVCHGRAVRADLSVLVDDHVRAIEPQPLIGLAKGRVVQGIFSVSGEKQRADTKVFIISFEIDEGTRWALG